MDQPKVERMLRLMMLLAGNVNYTVNDLAAKLETSYRSVYRYIDTFKAAGLIVKKNGEFYHIAKESRFFKDISQLVHFTDEEAYMVNKLIEGIDDTNTIKQNLRKKLATIYNCTAIADVIVKNENASNVNAIVEAIDDKKQIMLKGYSSSHTNKISDRIVEPFKFTTNYISVWCYEPAHKQNKQFKIDRIQKVEILNKAWQFEDKHASESVDIFRMSGKQTEKVRLRLSLRAKNLLIEEYPMSEKDITQEDENHWILATEISSPLGACRFIAGLPEDIEIIEGKMIKSQLHKYAKQLLKI